ncbi:MAG: DNRLRE domain-containing protein [Patulibacter minatonensis]
MPASASAADLQSPTGPVVDRDAFSTTTREGDAFRTRTFPEAVNFQDDDGKWKPIDRTLVRESDGSVHPAAVEGDVAIPSSISRPVVIAHDGRKLSFDLRGASGGRDLSAAKATFDDALSGVDVAYKVRSSGLKETLTLASRDAQRRFTYDVVGDADLTAKIGADGQLVFTDEQGEEKFRVAAPLAWDSAEPKAFANALELSVKRVAAGRWTLTLSADDAWLDDPDRNYPVTLDPDYYWIGESGALRFHGANQDCYVASNDQANYSFCAANQIQVGYYNRSFKGIFKFDVAQAIPSYATATKAEFLLWQPQSTPKNPAGMRLRTITRDWNDTATWNKANSNTAWTTGGGDVSTDANLTGAVTTVGAQNYWYYWQAPLAAVNGWIKGTLPNYGLQLATEPGSPPTTAYGFTSTDGDQAYWPALDVTWIPDTVAPDPVAALRLADFDGSTATFAWDPPTDPKLSDGTDGSGVAQTSAVVKVNGTARPAVVVDDTALEVTAVSAGNQVVLDLTVKDRAGNQRTSSVTVASLATLVEDPDVDEAAAEAHAAEFGTSMATSRAWMAAQNGVLTAQGGAIVDSIRNAAGTGGYGGAYFNNATRQFVVRLTSSANRPAVNNVLASLPASAATQVETAPFTAEHLGDVQARFEDQVVDLLGAGKVEVSGSERSGRLDVRISDAATSAERTRIQTTSTEDVPATFTVVPAVELASQPQACKWPYCDQPVRGGVRIDPSSLTDSRWCTLGLIGKRTDGARVGVTAGHCVKDIGGAWSSFGTGLNVFEVSKVGTWVYDGRGDWGILPLVDGLTKRSQVFVTKSKTSGPQTTRNPVYRINRASENVEDNYVCLAGATSGTRCGRVTDRRTTVKFDNGTVVRGLASTNFCGTGGDSGGSVFKGHIAYGIWSGGQKRNNGSCKRGFYTGAVTIQKAAEIKFEP